MSNAARQAEQRILRSFCDASAKHSSYFSPDFRPTQCVTVLILQSGTNQLQQQRRQDDDSSSSSSNNRSNEVIDEEEDKSAASKRFSFTSSVWPGIQSGAKIDVTACLVAACNISDTIAAAPWPAPVYKKNSAEMPLQLSLHKPTSTTTTTTATSSSSSSSHDDSNSNHQIEQVPLSKCSIRKTAARSFSFVSVVPQLCAANNVKGIDALRTQNQQYSSSSSSSTSSASPSNNVHGLALATFTKEWLANCMSSCTPSGSATIAVVFTVGLRLVDFNKLWISPHLRGVKNNNNNKKKGEENDNAADEEAAEELEKRRKREEKIKTRFDIVLLKKQKKGGAAAGVTNSNNNNKRRKEDEDEDEDDFVLGREEENDDDDNDCDDDYEEENEEENDPWALRANVCVIHTSNSCLLGASALLGEDGSPEQQQEAQRQLTLQQQQQLEQEQQQQRQLQNRTKANAIVSSRLQRLKAAGVKLVNEDEQIPTNQNQKQQEAELLLQQQNELHQQQEQEQQDVVETEFSVVSLRCPLSLQMLRVPVKGLSCEHDNCFELSTFVYQCLRDSSWNCPHCDRPAFFSQLVIDSLLESAVKNVFELNEVSRKQHEANKKKSNNKKVNKDGGGNEDEDSDDSDDDDDDFDVIDKVAVYPPSQGKPRRWEFVTKRK